MKPFPKAKLLIILPIHYFLLLRLTITEAFTCHKLCLSSTSTSLTNTSTRMVKRIIYAASSHYSDDKERNRKKLYNSYNNGDDLNSDSSLQNNDSDYTSTTSSNYDDDDTVDTVVSSSVAKAKPVMQTLSGGQSLIFAMARRMLVWDDEAYQQAFQINDSSLSSDKNNNNNNGFSFTTTSLATTTTTSNTNTNPSRKILPRWHPTDGIADLNPYFRNQPPAMNNRGYAALIRRNSRKRGKASLWRHAYRMYDKMKTMEQERDQQLQSSQTRFNKPISTISNSKLVIQRSTIHFEGALVACAKLGLWREAIGIYNEVVDIETQRNNLSSSSLSSSPNNNNNINIISKSRKVMVTNNMILSLIKACVRGSKARRKQPLPKQEQRLPLDQARDIVKNMERNHGFVPVFYHVNPLAAAYSHLGLYDEASQLIHDLLGVDSTISSSSSTIPSSTVSSSTSSKTAIQTNSHNQNSKKQPKDNASYNILINTAISKGDWTNAIQSLQEMTEQSLLYPTDRNVNLWFESAKKRQEYGVAGGKSGKKLKSWKRQRERILWSDTVALPDSDTAPIARFID